MYYRLKPQYVLRGWDKAAWAIVKRPENNIHFLSSEEFKALILCDGVTELAAELISLEMVDNFTLDGEKVIDICEEPTPLDEDQYYKYYDNRYVESVFWSITGKCNYRCRHCFMDAPEALFGEMNTEEALKLIDEMNECGVLRIDFTGGEPLVRKDFWLLVDRLSSYKIAIENIYTNGWLLNDKFLDKLDERNLKPIFHLSFDGVGWHDWMRGIDGAEQAAYRAIKLCKERGFRVGTQMCVHKGNKDTLVETMKVLGEMGVESIKFGDISPTELWCKNSEGNTLSWKEFLDVMLDVIPKFYEAGRPVTANFSGLVTVPSSKSRETFYLMETRAFGSDNDDECYICADARFSCYVGPDGRMLPCLPMTAASDEIQNKFPMVQEIGLRNALRESFYAEFVNRRVGDILKVNKKCAACNFKYKCSGGCRANAVLDSCDLMGCDKKLCTIYHGGYIERVRKIITEMNEKYGVEAIL